MMEQKTPLVSVVIPAYNVERYIDECLESVVSQTHTNLEIILVDDGSTDNTGFRCDAWAEKDSRIRVLHQANGGLSSARNAGIIQCNGEYLLVVDSDDRIKSNLIWRCVSCLEENQADLVHFGYSTVTENGTHMRSHPDPKVKDDELLTLILSNRLRSYSWQFLCKRSLYDGIFFPENRKAEDMATTYRLISRGHCVTITDCLYEYRARAGSILSNAVSDPEEAIRYCMDELTSLHEMSLWAQSTEYAEYVHAVQSSIFHHLFMRYRIMLAEHNEEGATWVSSRIADEINNINIGNLDRVEKWKTAMFQNGSLTSCYRICNTLRKTAKQLLRGIKPDSK